MSAGTAIITYTTSSCMGTKTVTVYSSLGSVAGSTGICVGSTTTLSSSASGGTWTSTNTSVASIDSTTGIVTGLSTGTSVISYSIGGSCTSTTIVTVNPMPSAISGILNICTAGSTTLSDPATGGVWSSSNTSVATVGSTGTVGGVGGGTAIITYALSTGCFVTTTVSVFSTLPAITGSGNLVAGGYTTLTDAVTGGSWSSSTTSVATAGSSSGVVFGVAQGTATITYTLSGGCYTTKVVTVAPDVGQIIITIAGTGSYSGPPFSGMGGPATAANFYPSFGLCTDASGNVYSGTNNARIIKIDASGIITSIAGGGTPGYSGDGGPATAASIQDCMGLQMDSAGNFYFADNSNNRIRKISTSGIITTIAGTGTFGYNGDGIPATSAQLNAPDGISVDGSGNVFIADTHNNRIREIDNSGIIHTIAGTGVSGYSGDGGPATAAAITHPHAVYADGAGNVYFAYDEGIRKINSSGIVSRFAGSSFALGYSGDGGPATAAELDLPQEITADASGNIYAVEFDNNVIRKINAAGIISTVAGNGYGGFSGDHCLATNAELRGPNGMCIDRQGCILIDDGNNLRIRKIIPNRPVAFIHGHTQSITVCANSVGDSLNSLLTVSDIDTSQTETWSVALSPSHGSLSASYYTTSTGDTLHPHTIYYTPTAGYYGNDTFSVAISDCGGGFDTTAIYVTVGPSPITGITSINAGTTTALSDATSGGTWSSSNTATATVGASGGIVGGVATGTAIITYALSGGCYDTALITVAGVPAAALNFNGTTNYAVNAGSTALLTFPLTVEAWVRPMLRSDGVFISQYPNNVVSDDNPGLYGHGFGATILSSASGVTVEYHNGFRYLPYTMTSGQWYHIAVVYTYGNVKTYVGTTLIDNYSFAQASPLTGASLINIGKHNDDLAYSTRRFFSGDIDELRIWNRALCIGEITNNLNCELSADTAGLVAYYKFNEGVAGGNNGTVTTAYDSSGHGNHATLNTFALSGAASNWVSPGGVTTGVTCPNYLAGIIGLWGNGNVIGDASTATSAANNTDFGTVAIGTSDTLKYVIKNTGTASFTVSTITLAGAAPGSYTAGGLALPATVAAGTSDTFTIIFSPAAAGVTTATVTVNNSTCEPAYTYAITGNGVCTPPTTPVMAASPVTACPGHNDTLRVTSGLLNSAASWKWYTGSCGGTLAGTGASIIVSPSVTTTYYARGEGGCVTPGSCGTLTVTVSPPPSVITGVTSICPATPDTLNDPGGGTWSSSNTTVATVGSSSGIVWGITSGTTTITYSLVPGCYATVRVVVYPVPSAITGVNHLCTGVVTTLTDATAGGTWASNNTMVASVGSATGIVGGAGAGTAVITYSLGAGLACSATTTVTVYSMPSSISGRPFVCMGQTETLSDTASGGTWVSSNTAVATIGSAGLITPLAAGSTTITYSFSTSCLAVKSLTVFPLSPIAGTTTVCVGMSSALSDATPGGAWRSSSSAIAGIGSASGLMTGGGAGTAIITYALPTGCYATTTVSVQSSPTAITGAANLCVGGLSALTDPGGGRWSSSSTAVASIDSASGVVSGIAVGTAVITYSLGSGCTTIRVVTVNSSPAAIAGPTNVCAGATIVLSNATGGGTWSSGSTTIATAGPGSGVIAGVSAGTATIIYTAAVTGCTATRAVTVNPLPPAISGTTSVCVGQTSALSDAAAGGTWSGCASAIATIDASGMVTGVGVGITLISYTLPTGCRTTGVITVNPSPSAISGSVNVCVGLTAALSSATPGGTWSSGDAAIASVAAATGIVTGVSAGTAVISYTLPTGCSVTSTITVSSSPSSIAGITDVCTGTSTSLSDVTTGGAWSSSNISIATVSGTGLAGGVGAGTAVITYSLGARCNTTTVVTVEPLPAAITGVAHACAGQTTTLYDATSGGAWSSSDLSTATIDAAGNVTGVSAGTATITYTQGCSITKTFTTYLTPAAISGSPTGCVGLTLLLSDATAGGMWASSNSSVASVDPFGGLVTGISAGTAAIIYALPTGCMATMTETINNVPPPVTGSSAVCAGKSIILSDAAPGGAWSSGNTSVATVDAVSGTVHGVSAGAAFISYTVNGCSATAPVTVNRLPAPITGTGDMCAGGITMPVYDADAPSGTWSSVDIGISPAGVVTSFAPGTGFITYTLPSGCYVTATVHVNPLPASISGPAYACITPVTNYVDASAGGAWSCSPAWVAAIGSATGVVNGLSIGSAVITYTAPGGCIATKTIAVNPQPAIVNGPASLCAGTAITLTDTTAGGVWSSNNNAVASADAAAGIITGISAGTVTISYSVTDRCGVASVTRTITVNPQPDAGSISGPQNVCIGRAISLSDTAGGGWWSGSGAITISAATGIVTGVAAGTGLVTYSVTNICGTAIAQAAINVTGMPGAGIIDGSAEVCVGASILLADSITNGSWTAGNANATVVNGIVTGVSAGADTIFYTVTNLCGGTAAGKVITVRTLPVAGSISGTNAVCAGAAATFTGSLAGGIWSSSNAEATVAGGIVTGVTAGSATISYTFSNICGQAAATQDITIIALPDAGIISGRDSVCAGDTIIISESVNGGRWSNANAHTSVSAAGVIEGLSPGRDSIYYTVANAGCTSIAVLPVTVRPAADCANNLPDAVGCSGEGDLSIYPNPNDGTFTINVYSPVSEHVQLIVVNMVGQKLSRFLTTTNKPLTVDLVVPRGVYIVYAVSGHGKCMEKIVVE